MSRRLNPGCKSATPAPGLTTGQVHARERKTHHDDPHFLATRGRKLVPLHCDDLSQFAKTLRAQLDEHLQKTPGAAPSHVQLLNMLARSAGHRSMQALRAQAVLKPPAAPPAPCAPAAPARCARPEGADAIGRAWPVVMLAIEF